MTQPPHIKSIFNATTELKLAKLHWKFRLILGVHSHSHKELFPELSQRCKSSRHDQALHLIPQWLRSGRIALIVHFQIMQKHIYFIMSLILETRVANSRLLASERRNSSSGTRSSCHELFRDGMSSIAKTVAHPCASDSHVHFLIECESKRTSNKFSSTAPSLGQVH